MLMTISMSDFHFDNVCNFRSSKKCGGVGVLFSRQKSNGKMIAGGGGPSLTEFVESNLSSK